MVIRYSRVAMLVAGLTFYAAAAEAQQFAGFGGLEPRLGVVWPRNATTGVVWALDADLGYVRPRVRAIVGMTGFNVDVDRRVAGAPIGGTLSAFGVQGALRLDPVRAGRFAPFVTALLTVHNVGANVSDPGIDELLDGVYAGIGFGAGVAYSLDMSARFSLTAEARRVFATNVGHGSLMFGMRWLPRGRQASGGGTAP